MTLNTLSLSGLCTNLVKSHSEEQSNTMSVCDPGDLCIVYSMYCVLLLFWVSSRRRSWFFNLFLAVFGDEVPHYNPVLYLNMCRDQSRERNVLVLLDEAVAETCQCDQRLGLRLVGIEIHYLNYGTFKIDTDILFCL